MPMNNLRISPEAATDLAENREYIATELEKQEAARQGCLHRPDSLWTPGLCAHFWKLF